MSIDVATVRMLVACVAILVYTRSVSCYGAGDVITTTPHSSPETNVKTFDILKEELQKNNDDYNDKSTDGSKATVKSSDVTSHSPRRRLLDAGGVLLSSTAPPDAAPSKPDAASPKPKKYSGGASAGAEAGASRNPKYVNKKPVKADHQKDKLRNFLDKYKVIVSELMANHSETPAPEWARSPRPPRRQQGGFAPGVGPGPALAPEPAQWSSTSGEGPVMRTPDTLPAGLDHRPASGAQLDMSPARGGLIHNLRNKHRLCFRHVMIPEGPKYDTKGKVYLAEYTRVRNRDYAHTRDPKLLLPKCCNCCRKSVLGCE